MVSAPTAAAIPSSLVSACSGVSLPRSVVTSILGPALIATTNGLQSALNGLLGPVLGINVDAAGLVAAAANGQNIGVSAVNLNGTLVGPGTSCNTTSNSYQLDVPAGLSIGGNRITGLGSNGLDATAGELNSIALGNSASTLGTATGAVGIGNVAVVNGAGGVAIGANAVAGTAGSPLLVNQVALGNGARATANNSIAIGAGSRAIAANSVAIGNNSLTGGRGASIGYTATGLTAPQNSVGTVSVGSSGAERQITNVAAGSAATDAVNVLQLATVAAAGQNSLKYDLIGGTPTNTVTLASGVPGSVKVTNLTAATLTAGSTDAVNGGQLFATNTQVATNTAGIATNTSAVASNTAAITANGTITAGNTISIAALNNGTAGLVQQDGGAPSDGPIRVGAGTGSTVVSFLGTEGNRRLTDVADATATTDAVNLGQLNSVAAQSANAIVYDVDGLGVRTNRATLSGAQGAAVTLANVAPGTLTATSSEAVNGAQLFATNGQVETNTANITTNTTNLGNLTTGLANGTVGLVQQAGGLPDGVISIGGATGGASINVAGTDGTRTITGVTAGVDATDAVNVGQLSAVGAVAQNGVQYDTAGGVKTNTVTLAGTPGAAVTVTNVAPGALNASSTDAVNGAQLFATNSQVETNTTNIATNTTNITANTTNLGNLTTGLANGTVGLVQQTGGLPDGVISIGGATGGASINVAGTGGTRTITGVTAGVDATDAVNVGQLAAVGSVAENAVQYDTAGGVKTNTVTLAGTPGAAVTVTNVAAGQLSDTSTDAVNGSQLFATNTQVTTNTNNIATNTTNLGNLTTGLANGTVGLVQQAGGLPGGVITIGAATGGTSVNVAGNDGARVISGVATGVAATDAANVGQVAAIGAVVQNSVQYDTVGTVRTNTVTLAGGSTGTVTVTNVAPAALTATSTDAVNGAQLFATNTQVATNTADIITNTTNIAGNTTAITNLTTSLNNGSVGLVQQTGGTPGAGQITVGGNTGGTSVTIAGTDGNRTLTGLRAGLAGSDAATVGQLAQVTGGAFNALQYDTDAEGGRLNTVTLIGGTAAPVGITNVADGNVAAGSTDAVNGGQLAATNASVAANTAGLAATNVTVANNTTAITAINNGAAGAFRSNNTAGAAAPSATGANATAGGFGATATASRAVAIGNGATATGINSVALGAGSSDGGVANVVSVGSVGAERRLTNVGPALNGTDAVNLSQLQAVQTQFGAATTGLQNQINNLNFDVRRVRRDADAATAGAMAVAALPQAFTPGAGMVGGGIGEWRGQVAFAVGGSKIIGDQTVIKAGASINTHGTGGFNAGVGYQF